MSPTPLGVSSRIFSGAFTPANADAISDAGWAAVFGLVLAVGSAILGAVLAAREEGPCEVALRPTLK